jgi:hypothetical protein
MQELLDMRGPLKLSEIHEPFGAARSDYETWLTRKEQLGLRTEYAETVSGSARRFSFENVLELALINAYVRAGVATPSTAAAYADMTLDCLKCGYHIHEFSVFTGGDFSTGYSVDSLDSVDFKAADRAAPVFSIVQVGEVLRRVKRLFELEG